MENGKKAPKFNTKQLIQWGMASLGGSTIAGIYAALLPIFYIDYLGLVENASIIYTIQIVYVIVNAINDPLAGIISDRSKSPKGRRIPFMRYTAPFLGLSFILIWFSPTSTSGEWAIFIWMVIMTCFYDTAFTIIFLAQTALIPELSDHEQERNSLQMYSSFFNLIGTVIGFIIPELFRNQSAFLLIISMITVGIFGSALIMYTTYKFEERPEFRVVDEALGFIDSIKATFKSKAFIILTIANFMSVLTQAIVLGSIYYLADYIMQTSSIILLVFIFLPLILGIWVTPKLIDKWGVLKSNQFLLMIGGSGMILMTFMPNLLIYLFLVIAAIGFIGPLVFVNVLSAQVIDEDELKTGVRREAMFFGIAALFTKPAQSVAIIIPTALLAAVNFIPHPLGTPPELNQPIGVFIAIRLVVGLIPGLGLLFSAFILQYYPIKGEYWKKIQKDILVLHEEKHAKLKEMERK